MKSTKVTRTGKVDLSTPERVWVNAPSIYQPYHKYHGKVGIAIKKPKGEVILYFTEGSIHSMSIDPLYIDYKN